MPKDLKRYPARQRLQDYLELAQRQARRRGPIGDRRTGGTQAPDTNREYMQRRRRRAVAYGRVVR